MPEPRIDVFQGEGHDSANRARSGQYNHARDRLACLHPWLDRRPPRQRSPESSSPASQSPTFEGCRSARWASTRSSPARAFGEVDPTDPRNAVIADIQLAPRNTRGMVEYSMDVFILKPVALANGNHRLLYYMNNRGNLDSPFFPSIGVLSVFNDGSGGNDPTRRPTPGMDS